MTMTYEVADALREVADIIQSRSGQKGLRRKNWGDDLAPVAGTRLYGDRLFGLCGTNDVISALVNDESFLRWLNWRRNNLYQITVKVLSWEGPEGAHDGSPSVGYMTNACEPPNSVEWGRCNICFYKGLYGRCGQDIATVELDEKYCESEPILRIDGTLVNNNAEWQAALAAQILRDDLSQDLVIGNHGASTAMFSGLENIIKTGYVDCETGDRCTHVDSIVVDWGSNGVAGIAALIQEILARLRLRAKSAGGFTDADVAIMVRTEMRDCIVNEFACEGPDCSDYAMPTIKIDVARDTRDRYLAGGANGDGYISVAGHVVSFLVNDWLPVESCVGGGAGSYVSDIYILVRRVGAREVLYGVYHDMTSPVATANSYGADFQATDGGRFLVYSNFDETCFKTCVMVKPALICEAPWVQARIQNVCCSMTELEPVTPEERNEYGINWDDLYPAGDEPNRQ